MAESGYPTTKSSDQPPIGFAPPPHAMPPMSAYNSAPEPPPSYFNSQPAAPQVGVLSATTVVIHQPALGSNPTRLTCPHCLADVTTNVRYETGTMTHVLACVLCCFVCWPCAWVPYATDCSKDSSHECPNCQRHLGTYKR